MLLLATISIILSQAADIMRIKKVTTTTIQPRNALRNNSTTLRPTRGTIQLRKSITTFRPTRGTVQPRNRTKNITTLRPTKGKSAIETSATLIRVNETSLKPQATYFFTNIGPNSFEYRGQFTGKTAFDVSKHFAAFFDHIPNFNDHKGRAFNLLQPRSSPGATPAPPVLFQFHPPPPPPPQEATPAPPPPPVQYQFHHHHPPPPPAQEITPAPPVLYQYHHQPPAPTAAPPPPIVNQYDFFRLSPNPNPPPPPPPINRFGYEGPPPFVNSIQSERPPFINSIQSERPNVDFNIFQPELQKYHIVRGQARAESYPKIFKFVDGRINIVDFEKKKKSRKEFVRLQKGDALDPDRVLRNKFLILHGGLYDRNQELLNGYGGSRGNGYFGNDLGKRVKYDPEFSEYFYRT